MPKIACTLSTCEERLPLRDRAFYPGDLAENRLLLFAATLASIPTSSYELRIGCKSIHLATMTCTAQTESPAMTGSCHCGAITFTSRTLPKQMSNCYCRCCSKVHGGRRFPCTKAISVWYLTLPDCCCPCCWTIINSICQLC